MGTVGRGQWYRLLHGAPACSRARWHRLIICHVHHLPLPLAWIISLNCAPESYFQASALPARVGLRPPSIPFQVQWFLEPNDTIRVLHNNQTVTFNTSYTDEGRLSSRQHPAPPHILWFQLLLSPLGVVCWGMLQHPAKQNVCTLSLCPLNCCIRRVFFIQPRH